MDTFPLGLVLFFFSAFIAYVYFGVYVLNLDRRATSNQLFFAACIGLSVWALAYTFAFSTPDAETALLWRRISALGYCGIYGVLMHFFLALTDRTEVLKRRYVYVLIYLPAVVLIYVFALSPEMARMHHTVFKTAWGWHIISLGWHNRQTVWNWVFNIYYSVAVLLGVALTWQWGRTSKALRKQKQANTIIATVVVSLIGASVADLILLNAPYLSVVFVTIPIWGTWYSIKRYRLMALSFQNAAENILKTMSEGLILIDKNRMIRLINRSTEALLGYRENELLGKPIDEVLADSDGNTNGERAVTFKERTMLTKGGDALPVLFSASHMRDEWGDDLGLVCIFSDITDRKLAEEALQRAHDELEERVRARTAELAEVNESLQAEIAERQRIRDRIEYLAYHDHLTDLPNRLLFTERLQQAILQADRNEKMVAVLFLDLDAFKRVNDTMGHAQGDRLLVEVSRRLSSTLRKSDTVARLGGDEFLVMTQNFANVESVAKVSEKVIRAFNEPVMLEGQEFYMTVSIGVAVYPLDGTDVESLIKNADIAMYKAKDNGRNRYVLCSPAMKDEVVDTMRLTNSLYRALERNELMLYYQPQMSCQTGEVVGLEALLRWRHPERGMIPPNRFIPIAESTGLIMPIGEWVLRTACKQTKAWQDAGLMHTRMAVNLSLYQFQNQDLVGTIAATLKEVGLRPEYLELEITETLLMDEAEFMIETLRKLKDLGISLAIDDFGAKYSSMMYLKQLPVDRIKIAMPFVQGISVSEKDEAIAIAIIILAHNLGLQVIAEGVETDYQHAFLTQRMCDEIQGYYYHKPMPASEVEALLRKVNGH